ncbi:hypothetical protein [Pseudobutyrivibrio sp.]|uniref:hypothetical protein n=1 Tax=Pseudobutyrivibrio sp. TaxID=2014367 RepID=UPI001DC15058|nr:hypothetical protein [Pseudobutyrivibrio sp.]MBE5912270.1 hypothetical protein [Pseudobutyrivibrio sp.]
MRIIVNDVSWHIEIYDRITVCEKLNEFACLCKFLLKKSHNLSDRHIYSVQPVDEQQYYSMAKMKDLLKDIDDRECCRLIAGVINNSPVIEVENCEPMLLENNPTYVFGVALDDDIIISLDVADWVRKDELTAFQNDIERTLKNVYSIKQSHNHSKMLGYRIFKSNPKHNHKNEIMRSNGMVNSPMDLDDETAQELLDNAIFDEWSQDRRDMNSISEHKDKKLYARLKDTYYEFQGTDNVYHGYAIDRKELQEKCSLKLLKVLDR